MITAWDIYWVMQLDSIGSLLFMASLLGIVGGGILQIIRLLAAADDKDAAAAAFVRITRFNPYILTAAILAAVVNGFLPSTKTAAAMIVLPALSDIASSETVQHEAGELYGIAKDALRELAKPKPEPKKDDSPERVTP